MHAQLHIIAERGSRGLGCMLSKRAFHNHMRPGRKLIMHRSPLPLQFYAPHASKRASEIERDTEREGGREGEGENCQRGGRVRLPDCVDGADNDIASTYKHVTCNTLQEHMIAEREAWELVC